MTDRTATLDDQNPELKQAVLSLTFRLPAYGRLYWRLLREGDLSGSQRVIALGALIYTISPIDLVPGVIPVLGQLDDLAVALLGLRLLLRSMPPPVAEGHLLAAGLTQAQLDADIATLGRTVATLGRQSIRLASAAARLGAQRLGATLRRLRGRDERV